MSDLIPVVTESPCGPPKYPLQRHPAFPPPPEYRTCECGSLIVLAHGDDECAVCYMKRRGLWEE